MHNKSTLILSLFVLALVLGACATTSASQETAGDPDPWAYMPTHLIHTDHSSIVQGPFNSGQQVTQACLKCHADSADQVMHTTHWTWEGEPVSVPWRDEPVTIGKKTQINNFCISSQGNEKQCMTCHQTMDHVVQGKLLADNYTIDPTEQVACEDCHQGTVHSDERITQHTDSVACQTCHVPAMALKDPTKTFWDWSTAGQDLPEDHYTYLKIKGNFEYRKDVLPTYQWFNGNIAYRYLLGDPIDPSKTTDMVIPAGDIDDPTAKIFPFKIHTAKQPYDTVNNILIPPRTAGEGGFWDTFDWPSAIALGAQDAGLDYSSEFGFAETTMAYPTTHMVQPKENALQCTDCHGKNGRLDWEALGYHGDPMEWGGRDATRQAAAQPSANASSQR